MLLPVLLVSSALVCCIQADRMKLSDNVEEIVAMFRKMEDATDVIDSLERIGDNSKELFDLGAMVGRELRNISNPTWVANSTQSRALEELHNLFDDRRDPSKSESDDGDYVLRRMAALTDANRNTNDVAIMINEIKTSLNRIFNNPRSMLDPYIYLGFYNIFASDTILSTMNYDTNHSAVLSEMHRVEMNLLKVILAKAVIRVIEEDACREDPEFYVLLLEKTGHQLAQEARNEQDLTWREIGTDSAKKIIESDYIPISSFNETARKVKKAFEEIGSKSFSYQVLVVPTSEMGIEWSVASEMSDIYTNITNYNGIDIHIFRFITSQVAERAVNAWIYMLEAKKKLHNPIRSSVFRHYEMRNTSSFLEHYRPLPLYGEDIYRSVIIFREEHIAWDKKLHVPVGKAISQYASYTMESTLTLKIMWHDYNKGEPIYAWKAYFFL